MNYAWSNPTTGLREQTQHAYPPYFGAELGPLRIEARRRAWQSLQDDPETPLDEVQIYEQVGAGSVTQESQYEMGRSELTRGAAGADWEAASYQFAFAQPITGLRTITEQWPAYLKEVLADPQLGFISEVVIYASRPAFIVHRSDPEPPPQPEPAAAREHPELDDLDALHQQVSNFIDIEQGNPAPKATALALIDIARSLRRLLGEFTPPNLPTGQSLEDAAWRGIQALCTCTGDGLTADGAYCVCPAGMARKRAAAVASKPIPVQESPIYREVTMDLGGTDSKASPDSTKEPGSGE